MHVFGGQWTADKLTVLEKYLRFYTQALKGQGFQLIYIDAFAGTGRCHVRAGRGVLEPIPGSAARALDCAPAFDRLHFIERKPRHVTALQEMAAAHAMKDRVHIHPGDARDQLPQVLDRYSKHWRRTRGVLFLDPYGLQCTWDMVQAIASTKALDVFFLVSLSGLYRQAAVNASGIDAGKAARLTQFLGTDGWRHALYTHEQSDLFDSPKVEREPGYRDILNFTTDRLRQAFAHVLDPVLLGQVNGAPLFALYLAVSNPHKSAVSLADRVGREILKPLR